MNRWRRGRPYLALTVMLVVGGAGLMYLDLVLGIDRGDASGPVLPCEDLPGHAVPSQGGQHLSYLGERHGQYISSPPTSGPHMPWIMSSGVYRTPVPREYQVHLLEHGNVLIQYPSGAPGSARTTLERFARKRPDVVVVAPSGDVHAGIALTAWQRIDLLPAYDEHRIQRFVSALAGRYDHGWSDNASDCIGAGRDRPRPARASERDEEPSHTRSSSAAAAGVRPPD